MELMRCEYLFLHSYKLCRFFLLCRIFLLLFFCSSKPTSGISAKKGILVGYSSESKAYRILNPVTKQVYVSRSVKFNEKGEWDWSKMEPENSKSVLEQDHFQQKQELPVDNEEESDEDDYAIRGTRSLEEIYSRCNVVSLEPT